MNALKTRKCIVCLSPFVYKTARGRRGLGTRSARGKNMKTCSNPNCSKTYERIREKVIWQYLANKRKEKKK